MNALVYVDINKVARNEKGKKNYMSFLMSKAQLSKVWQILKRFAGTFRRAQTLNLGGVY